MPALSTTLLTGRLSPLARLPKANDQERSRGEWKTTAAKARRTEPDAQRSSTEPVDTFLHSKRRHLMLANLTGLVAWHLDVLGAASAVQAAENLPSKKLVNIIAHDFQHNQYYITGNLSTAIYTKDCIFVDPTTRVQGVETYCKAVAALFRRESSQADLISIEATEPNLVRTTWRFAASLNVPGSPKLKPYTGSTVYKLNTDGLVYEHREEWDISALDAFVSILFPSFGAPPAPPVQHPIDL